MSEKPANVLDFTLPASLDGGPFAYLLDGRVHRKGDTYYQLTDQGLYVGSQPPEPKAFTSLPPTLTT